MAALKLAVIGAGGIGKRHAAHIAAEPMAGLSGIADPSPAARMLAETLGARWFASFADLLAADRPDGVVIATPNRLHVDNGLEAVAAGLPALVEKPIADDAAGAARLVEAAEAAGVPLLVGHHRRFNPLIGAAKDIIDAGRLGRVVAVHGHFWRMKPEAYFNLAWRREEGGGPVLINLSHDIDLFRHLCGEVASVMAQVSNAERRHAVEDTAAILLRFASGALGTLSGSDCVVAPWSWELTSGENPAYIQPDQSCCQIAGTHGSLTIPQLELWANPGERSWTEPLVRQRLPYVPGDPLRLQIRHFCDVICAKATPIVSGREGLATLRVIEAVKESARTGTMITLD
jgi:predicted dehydrogenase